MATTHGSGTPDPQTVALWVTAMVVAYFPGVAVAVAAGAPPKVTTAPQRNPLPLIMTRVPPLSEPLFGEIPVTDGGPGGFA